MSVLNADKVAVLSDVSFAIARGEILGVAGVSGSGQRELCETIAGLMGAPAAARSWWMGWISPGTARATSSKWAYI